jgi:hypothetical protein
VNRVTKLYKIIFPFLFPLIGLVIIAIIYFQLSDRIESLDFSNISVTSIVFPYLIGSFFLMFLNWALEAIKWGTLVDLFQKLSFRTKLTSVFMGLSVGFLTPNRVGDFAGRLRYIHPDNRLQSIHASFVASIYQTTVTILIGGCALVYWMNQAVFSFSQEKLIYFVSIFTVLSFVILVFRMKLLILIILEVKWLTKFSDRFNWFINVDKQVLQKVFVIALVRYLVFMLQYFLIIKAFQIDAPFILVVSAISTIYLLTTIIPTSTLSDLLLRGAVNLLIFGTFISSEEVILIIAALVWGINIVIPSLIGTGLFILNRSK